MLNKSFKFIGENLIGGKTPQFWGDSSFAAQLLIPLSVVYFLIKRLLAKKVTAQKFPFKVICIGNAVVGGAGKTPTAIAVHKELQKKYPAAKIAFVTTAYKADLQGPLVVEANHTADDVGDEALMLSRYGTVIICKDRVKALEFAATQNIDYAILDDGLHDKRIVKDITFLVNDGKYGFGNNMVLPAGPLRDRLDFATEGTNYIILIGKDERDAVRILKHATKKIYPVINSYIDVVTNLDKTQVYVAFAGLGRPEKFFNMLSEMGFVVAEKMGFADHYFYSKYDIETLQNLAKAQKAKLVCTEKDFVKLPADFAAQVECVKIELKFETREIEGII